ncbi:hypothetical protein M0804_004611 [Polistes exclamans]|nr:hypothetical protein M0804_004611 [Polistes exclamans]
MRMEENYGAMNCENANCDMEIDLKLTLMFLLSFYGASYIHLPVQEAKGATDISFRFRTHLSDAMLLLAAGKTDYCLIKLEAGRLKVHINLGAGESEMASARGLTLNDLSWHEVNLTRREANITLQIDVIHTTRSLLPGRFFELNIHYGVFIGGQGDFNELFLEGRHEIQQVLQENKALNDRDQLANFAPVPLLCVWYQNTTGNSLLFLSQLLYSAFVDKERNQAEEGGGTYLSKEYMLKLVSTCISILNCNA